MNIKYTFGIMAVIIAFILGCSGTLGKIKTKSGEDRTATIKAIKENLDDYDIHHCPLITALDPKNDDKTVKIIDKSCSPVDHQTASDFVREYPMKKFPVKGLKEVLGPDDKLYGYLIIWNNKYVSAGAKLAEDKTMQVYPYYVPVGGP